MKNKKIYLCGPINGCTDEECNDWRTFIKNRFKNTIDPMRRDYRGRELESVNEIVQIDKIDVLNSDIIIASCPKPSVGTSMEIFFGWENNKLVVAVVPDGTAISPWLKYHSTTIVNSFEKACDWINENFK